MANALFWGLLTLIYALASMLVGIRIGQFFKFTSGLNNAGERADAGAVHGVSPPFNQSAHDGPHGLAAAGSDSLLHDTEVADA